MFHCLEYFLGIVDCVYNPIQSPITYRRLILYKDINLLEDVASLVCALNKQVEANDLLPINALSPGFKPPQVACCVREGWDLAGFCIFYREVGWGLN